MVHLVRVSPSGVLKPRDAQPHEVLGHPRPHVGDLHEPGHRFLASLLGAGNSLFRIGHRAPFAAVVFANEAYTTIATPSVAYLCERRMLSRATRLLELMVRVQAKPRFTAAELTEEFGVSRRTMQRDLAALAGMGVPLRSTPGPGGPRRG